MSSPWTLRRQSPAPLIPPRLASLAQMCQCRVHLAPILLAERAARTRLAPAAPIPAPPAPTLLDPAAQVLTPLARTNLMLWTAQMGPTVQSLVQVTRSPLMAPLALTTLRARTALMDLTTPTAPVDLPARV